MQETTNLELTECFLDACGGAGEKEAFHGGKSFEAIGEDFAYLERAEQVIGADVLDAWFDPSPHVLEKLRQFLPFIARASPPVRAKGLIAAIARERGVPDDCILAAGGSSDLIFACLPHWIPPNGTAMILDPMYGEYQYVLGTVLGVAVTRFELRKENDFCIDTDALIRRVRADCPDIVILVNPNSPTGQYWHLAELIRCLDEVPGSVRILVDETYLEYVEGAQSIEVEASQRSNLLVIKSMSKAYALSGMRAGYLTGHPRVIRDLAKWIPPWAVSLPAQIAAVEALSDPSYYRQRYLETRLLRDELACELKKNPRVRIYPSNANFLLLETQSSAQKILEHMRAAGVYIRNCDSMSNRFADRFLRIAVKQRSANRRIVESLFAATEGRI